MPTQAYEWLGRRPHFRLFDKDYKLPPSSFATMPDVIGNWWRTANGETVLLAANLSGKERTVRYRPCDIAAARPEVSPHLTLTLRPYELRRIAAS